MKGFLMMTKKVARHFLVAYESDEVDFSSESGER